MKQKLKQCRTCKKDVVYYKDKQCLSCFKRANPEKFQIKKANKSKPIPKTPIKKTPIKKSNKPIAKYSKTQKALERLHKYQKVRDAFLASKTVCDYCGLPGILECHHAHGRSGKWLYNSLKAVHRHCHIHIHQNPEESYANGMMESRIKKDSNVDK